MSKCRLQEHNLFKLLWQATKRFVVWMLDVKWSKLKRVKHTFTPSGHLVNTHVAKIVDKRGEINNKSRGLVSRNGFGCMDCTNGVRIIDHICAAFVPFHSRVLYRKMDTSYMVGKQNLWNYLQTLSELVGIEYVQNIWMLRFRREYTFYTASK